MSVKNVNSPYLLTLHRIIEFVSELNKANPFVHSLVLVV
jgi:hypothetical protein